MAQSIVGPEIERLIQLLARLPGLGPRSARRAALHLMKKKEALMEPLARAAGGGGGGGLRLLGLRQRRHARALLHLPRSRRATPSILVVVEDVGDLWALERAAATRGRYHVLGGVLSPLDGIGPDDLNIASLSARVRGGGVAEVILAMNATVEGQTTAHYITDQLAGSGAKVTRLAHGVPVGGELDYLDDGTLTAAMKSRTPF